MLDLVLWLEGPPTPRAQAALLGEMRGALEPVLVAHKLPADFVLAPGVRLRERYGVCQRRRGQPARLTVRCTADGDKRQWRRSAAILRTLLHEAAHLRHPHHGPAFWALLRRLLDGAASAGLYDASEDDAAERARGDEKLAGSAADAVARAARSARRARARDARADLSAWRVGTVALVGLPRGRLAGARVRVIGHGRTRLLVEASDGRRYLVSPGVLAAAS